MGACTFTSIGRGKNPQEAFNEVVEQARYESGHGGYSGTIAEKDSFVIIHWPKDVGLHDFIDKLIEDEDKRIDDKWGPAGCIALGNDKYIFFGWASE